MKLKDYLNGKNVLFYGDSITHNWNKYDHFLKLVESYDGKSFSGYVGLINEAVKANITNKAVSGGCYANVSAKLSDRPEWRHFPYQIDHSLDELKNADVIFVFFGSNDYYEQNSFGKFDEEVDDPNKANTFYSGMNYGFKRIKELNPNAKVFVLTVLPITLPTNAPYSYSTNEYNLAIKHNAKRFGFNVIDISTVYKCPENYPNGSGLCCSDDGLHPNANGYKLIADYILNYQI